MGALRPREKTGQHRMLWRAAHRTVGATTMALGAFLVHHSLIVFQVERWPSISVNGLLVVMACAVVAVHVFVRKPSADGPHHAYTAVSAQDDIDIDHAVLLDFDQDKQEIMA